VVGGAFLFQGLEGYLFGFRSVTRSSALVKESVAPHPLLDVPDAAAKPETLCGGSRDKYARVLHKAEERGYLAAGFGAGRYGYIIKPI
jgi:hypothetical protein